MNPLYRQPVRLSFTAILVVMSVSVIAGCGRGDQEYLSMGTAPTTGAFYPIGTALSQVLNEHGGGQWEITAQSTNGTRENIRKLDKGELDLALANASITYHAVRGIEGWEKKFPVQAVMTLGPNVGHFVTVEGSGITTMADLKGKRVAVGPAGAGFEFFIKPILAAHGISYDDIRALNNTPAGSVDMLADGSADAAFLGGAMPHPSIIQACSSLNIVFIPFDPQAREALIQEYSFFNPITVPASAYSDLNEDFAGLNVGSIHLIVSASAEQELVYKITKTLWEHREDVVKKHKAGKAINEENVARSTGTDFHPGAIRFYEEIQIWKAPGAKTAKTADE